VQIVLGAFAVGLAHTVAVEGAQRVYKVMRFEGALLFYHLSLFIF
jgi:hypothetical protein